MKGSPNTKKTTAVDLEEIEVACALYDNDGRLVSCDENYRNLYNYSELDVTPGVHYSDLDKLDLERGVILLDEEQEADKEYLKKRKIHRAYNNGSFTFQLRGNRWVKVTYLPLRNGGFASIQQDITAKRLAEEELSHTSELFKTAFHLNNNVCTISVLETGLYLDINDAWLDTFGFKRHEAIGKTAFQLNPWGKAENRHRFVDTIRKGGSVSNYEAVLRTRSGELRNMIASASIVEIGGVECLFFSAHDVTEIKHAEKAIKLSEERFRTIFENAPIGMALFNLTSSNVQIANKRYLEILGRTHEEINDLNWRHLTHPSDIQTDLKKLADLNSGKYPYYKVVKRYLKPDRSIVWAETSIINIETGDSEQPVQRLSMIEDISEKKEIEEALTYSKEQFAHFALASADWYWEMNKDQHFTFISSVAGKGTGARDEEFLGRTVKEILVDDYVRQDTTDYMHYCIDNKESFRDLAYWRLHPKTGKKVWLKASGVPFYDTEGEYLGFRGVSSDITEQKALEEKLQQSQKMEAVGQLTGGVAHDFNNLLAVIIGNAELLRDSLAQSGTIDPSQIDAILRAGDRGSELTQSMLAFSRKQDLQPQVIQLDKQIEGMISLLRRTLGEMIDIQVNIAPDLMPCKADPGKLDNALLNMAINARDAMPDGGTLTIDLSNCLLDEEFTAPNENLAPGKYVLLVVQDTGMGIEPETLTHVFEPFFTTKEIGKGTGLGLSMIYGFAQQSKGHINIASELGRGTTLKLYLPQSP